MTVILCLYASLAFAGEQAIARYYSNTETLSGYSLKSKLASILRRDHKPQHYGALLGVYFESDLDTTYENDGSILDIYSEVPSGSDPYIYNNRSQKCGNYRQESDCFNREHIFPQGIFHKASPMRTDFHHIYPTDGEVNGKRSRHPFGEVGKATWRSMNGSKLGVNTTRGYNGTVFEPIDEFKGDIARALLYFATRYESRVASWTHPMLDGSREQVYADWFINLLLKWHKNDPVSAHEIHRNNVGQSFQGNRNPYIDHPEWVSKIWKNRKIK